MVWNVLLYNYEQPCLWSSLWEIWQSTHPFICPFIPSFHPFFPSIYIYISITYIDTYLCTYIHTYIHYPFVHTYIHPSIHPYIHTLHTYNQSSSIHPSIYPSHLKITANISNTYLYRLVYLEKERIYQPIWVYVWISVLVPTSGLTACCHHCVVWLLFVRLLTIQKSGEWI